MGIFVLSGTILKDAHATAPTFNPTPKNLTITANVKDAISLSLSSHNVAFDLTPTPNGTFKTGNFNATVSTSNSTGYTLYVASTGLDHNGDPTSSLIPSSPQVSADSVITTIPSAVVVSRSGDAYTNTSNFSSNKWAFSSSFAVDGTNVTFSPISTTNTAIKASGTNETRDENIEDDTTNIVVGTKVDTNIYADTYSNTLTITAMANSVFRTFTINYVLNGGTMSGDTGTHTQAESIADDYYPTLTISNTTPTRAGYNFLGWATSADNATNGIVAYNPGDDIDMDYEDPTVTLYAAWSIKSYNATINLTGTGLSSSAGASGSTISMSYGGSNTVTITPSSGYKISAASCTGNYSLSPAANGQTSATTFTISNGNNDNTATCTFKGAAPPPAFYTITKMQEMTHAICTDSQVITPKANATTTLTKDNWDSLTDGTGIPTTTLLDDRAGQKSYTVKKLADGKCWMTESLALPAGAVLNASNSDLDGTKVSSYTIPTSTAQFTNSPAYDIEAMNSDYTNTTNDPRGYKTGNYYSWRTATAGTGRGGSSAANTSKDPFNQSMSTRNNNTLVSICPKGWRLPTSGNNSTTGTTDVTTPGSATNLVNGDFAALYRAYGGTGTSGSDTTMYAQMTGTSYGPNLSLSGNVNTGGRSFAGSYGYFWSSTVSDYRNAYLLVLSTSYVYSQSTNNKYYGFSVRCLAR